MKHDITSGEKYGPAMKIEVQAEADDYFEECVANTMAHGKTRDEAERIERSNLGYFAGYYGSDTRARVERLFRCAHPVFGAITDRGEPTVEEAIEAGKRMATEPSAEEHSGADDVSG